MFGRYLILLHLCLATLVFLTGCNSGPSKAEFHTLKAEMYLRAGENGRAQQELDIVFADDDLFVDALLLQSRLYALENKSDKAIEQLKKAEQSDPKNLDVLYSLGFMYSQKGDFQKAIDIYTAAISVKPDTALGYNNIAVAYHSKKDFVQAEKNYRKAIQLDSNFVEAYYNLGNTYSMMNSLENALVQYNKAVQLKPDYTDPYIELSAVYNKLGNKSEAGNNVGLYYFWKQQYEQAIKAFTDVIAANPTYAVAYNNRAVCYDKLGNREKSIIDLQQSAKLGYYPAIEICRKNNIDF